MGKVSMRGKLKRILSRTIWTSVASIIAASLSGGIIAYAQASPGAPAGAPVGDQALIEKGRETVGQTCVACHTNILRMLQTNKKSPEQWRDTVYSMIGRGAQIMPDEIESVNAFLVANAAATRQTTTQAGGRAGAGRGEPQGPEGEGRALLQQRCVQCHDMAKATTKLPTQDWNAVIAKMMTFGARLTPDDQQKLIAYLNGLAK